MAAEHERAPLTLPVLPLDDEVVLPGMVVPLDLSDTEVRAAVEAAQAAARPDGGASRRCCSCRGSTGRTRGIGVLGTVEQVGRLPGGEPGRAHPRRAAGCGSAPGTTGPGRGAVGGGHRGRGDRARAAARRASAELAKEYKALATSWLQKRGAWQVVDRVQQIDDASALADNSGYSPFLTTEQKVELLETADPVARLKLADRAGSREHLAEQDVAESIAQGRPGGRRQAAARVPAAPQLDAVRKELRRAQRRRRRGRGRRLPRPRRGRRPAGEGARGRAQGGRQAGADLRPVARGRLDPHLARHRPRTAVERADRGRLRHRAAPRRSSTPTTPAWTT